MPPHFFIKRKRGSIFLAALEAPAYRAYMLVAFFFDATHTHPFFIFLHHSIRKFRSRSTGKIKYSYTTSYISKVKTVRKKYKKQQQKKQ